MSISYNYFLPTNMYGTLRVTDLSFAGYSAVNANIYCQRNINCDGQLQCGQFHSLGTAYFDQVPTCINGATAATQLTNYQTVQGLIAASGGVTLAQAIDGVHASTLPFTAQQTINNNLIITNPTVTTSKVTISENSTTGQCIFTNQGNVSGQFLFVGYNGVTPVNLFSISSTLCSITSTSINLNTVNANSLVCSTTATFNGNYPTTTLGNNSGTNNNEFSTVGYAKSIGGTSILPLNNTWTGINTFQQPIISSGASLTANTIPAASIVNNSITNSQIASGSQLVTTNSQTFTGIKSLSNLLNTTGITDTLSISSPIMQGGYFQATNSAGINSFYETTITGNLNVNTISNPLTSQMNIYSGSVSIPGGTNANSGLQIGWNNTGGTGETNFTNLAQGGSIPNPSGGGFQFGTTSNNLGYRALCAMNPYSTQGFWLFSNAGRLRIDDRNGGSFWWGQSQEGSQMLCSVNGISTSYTVGCANASGVGSTCLSVSTTGVTISPPLNTSSTITSTGIISAPSFTATNSAGTSNFWGIQTGNANISGTLSTANITAQGLTTFNTNHPTTSLGNNISTNTTQYATVGFVNSNSGTALLASNNTWTGSNAFTQRYISVGNATAPVTIGNGNGNISNVNIGDPLSLGTISASGSNICISSPLSNSMYVATGGSSNICLGGSSATLLTSGSSNTFLGSGCGQTITTGSNNTILGAGAWSTGTANFSNCTVLGTNAPPPVANNSIVIGSSSETVYVVGASQLNNSLLYGTTVCSSDFLQINNQTKRFHTSYTTGVTNTLTNPLPYMILFTPIAGMSFVLPVPSATNAGQTFILRKQAAGAGSVIFSCTGNPAVWVPLNSGTANTSLTITTIWQFTIYSTGSLYLTIA
jgi:hypothetical protein